MSDMTDTAAPLFNLSTVFQGIAEAIPDVPLLTWRGRHHTYREVDVRADGIAHYLTSVGMGCQRERSELQNHESGQDHLALYLLNGNEYIEAMIGAYRARVAPFNCSYRYVEAELIHMLTDSRATGIVYHARFAPVLASVRDQLPDLRVLIQVADESGNDLLPGAVDYESIVTTPAPGAQRAGRLDTEPATGMPTPSGEDLYLLYTGGTTGMPKGVMYTHRGAYLNALADVAIKRYKPFAPWWWVMGKGNHETAVLKNKNTDLTSMLVHGMNTPTPEGPESFVQIGGYGGWVRFQFTMRKTVKYSLNLKYHHGAGGGGPVTRGVIDTNRQAVYLPDADIVALVEQVTAGVDVEAAQKLAAKVKSGGFDLNDFLSQIQQMKSMGGLSSLMDKMPAQMQAKAGQVDMDKAERDVRRKEGIIQSMTPLERRKPELIKATRKRRIAAGAGVQVQEVNRLLNQFEQMQGMMKKMKGGGLMKMMKRMGGMKGMPKLPGMG